jgi:hypothetical protein
MQHSVNAVIDTTKFQCTWGTFSQCYLIVANSPAGMEAVVFDVNAAFRNVPTHPSVRPFLAVQIAGLVHLDHCLNFGASPCPGMWGRIADAMVEIFHARGIRTVIKWVDDFVFFRYLSNPANDQPPDYEYEYDETTLHSIAEPLGWPWSPTKCFPFASTFTYIGFSWDLVNKTVFLPDQKKSKYLQKLEHWRPPFMPTCKEVESLIGTFNHVNLILPNGKTHMLHLYKLQASSNHSCSRWLRHKLSQGVLDDISWWRSILQEPFVGMPVIQPPAASNNKLYVDASMTWGIGLLLNG